MKLTLTPLPLTKRHPLTISRGTEATSDNLLVTVEADGTTGYGEFSPVDQASPPETAASATQQLLALAPELESLSPWEFQKIDRLTCDFAVGKAAQCGLDIALQDWCGKRTGLPAYRLFGADTSRIVATSLTIGINPPEVIRERVAEIIARLSPRSLKIKLGSPAGCDHDRAIFATILETAPKHITLRVDANGGWTDVETALDMMRWLAERGAEYVEQPLAEGREADLLALFRNRPLPIYADESCRVAEDIPGLADRVDGVNLKLMKAGGPRQGIRLIHVARAHSLKVMMGCMSESPLAIAGSVAISAYADHLDLDSHLNILDPLFDGLLWRDGRVLPSEGSGMGVARRTEETTCHD
jgi:L-alanine-DL-glutamate epimerase-like enolase superfamily enzyme